MARIQASKVIVTRSWIVDCEVCGESVEPIAGGFPTRKEADEAKRRHLDQHALGAAQPDPRPGQ